MRKLCPNVDQEDGLETVLEVPIPEEMFTRMGSNAALRWQNMRTLMKSNNKTAAVAGRHSELQLLLNVVGSPLIPLQVQSGESVNRQIRDCSIVRFYILCS